MDKKRKRAKCLSKTIEELEILNETFVSKQQNAYRKLYKTVKNLRLHGGKKKSNKKNVELEKMLNISRDENFALKIRIDELEKGMEEKETDFKDLESFNQNMMVREHKYNYENQEARQELMKSMKGLQGGVTIGVKRLGDLDPAPFVAAVMKQKSSGSGLPKADSKTDSSVEARRLCSLWEKHLRDPGWHPYRMLSDGDKHQEIIDDEDPKLKGLKADLGEDAYKAVTTSLMELNEYNPSGRYPVSEIWNFVEGRKASLKEGYGFVYEKLKNVGKSSVVSSSSIAIAVENPSSSAPRPNVAATNPSFSAPRPNVAATNPSSSALRPNTATTNPSSSPTSPNIGVTNSSSSAPSYLDPCEIPHAEFHDFKANISYEKFQSGQIWALYCDSDDLPKYYVQITEVKLIPDFELHVRRLDSSHSPRCKLQWADKNMPICCGMFKVGAEAGVYKDVKAFSHQLISAKHVDYEIYPRRGEVWALYDDFDSKWTCSDLKKCKYVIVEVRRITGRSKINVAVLEQVTGLKTVFKQKKNSAGGDIVREITQSMFLTFSHQIPAFQLKNEKEGSLRGYWELDPNSTPVYLFSSD